MAVILKVDLAKKMLKELDFETDTAIVTPEIEQDFT